MGVGWRLRRLPRVSVSRSAAAQGQAATTDETLSAECPAQGIESGPCGKSAAEQQELKSLRQGGPVSPGWGAGPPQRGMWRANATSSCISRRNGRSPVAIAMRPATTVTSSPPGHCCSPCVDRRSPKRAPRSSPWRGGTAACCGRALGRIQSRRPDGSVLTDRAATSLRLALATLEGRTLAASRGDGCGCGACPARAEYEGADDLDRGARVAS